MSKKRGISGMVCLGKPDGLSTKTIGLLISTSTIARNLKSKSILLRFKAVKELEVLKELKKS